MFSRPVLGEGEKWEQGPVLWVCSWTLEGLEAPDLLHQEARKAFIETGGRAQTLFHLIFFLNIWNLFIYLFILSFFNI